MVGSAPSTPSSNTPEAHFRFSSLSLSFCLSLSLSRSPRSSKYLSSHEPRRRRRDPLCDSFDFGNHVVVVEVVVVGCVVGGGVLVVVVVVVVVALIVFVVVVVVVIVVFHVDVAPLAVVAVAITGC